MAFKMKSPFPQKPEPRKGDVYVGPKPTIIKDGKEVPNPNYFEGGEFKMFDKPMYEGQQPSTHLMAYGESDGKFVAYPTLFQDKDGVWYEPDDPFKEAIDKEEIYQFNTEQEAADFAAGSWKNK
tara:strand:+ start:560 stop:931 length:372 start_codon:yes stop_codon:yes gene_type:complete